MHKGVIQFAALSASAALMGACGASECVVPPCLPPFAVVVNVKSASGESIHNASIAARSGSVVNTVPCDTECVVPGAAGKYDLTVTAPGFAASNVSVTVTGKDASNCGCPTVDTQHIDVRLTPA